MQLTATIPSGVIGQPARIPVVPVLWFEVELALIPLHPVEDLIARGLGSLCRALSATSSIAQLMVTTPRGRTGPLARRLVAREPKLGPAPAPIRLRSMAVETVLTWDLTLKLSHARNRIVWVNIEMLK